MPSLVSCSVEMSNRTINANMIAKRGSKVLAYVPIFVDDRTDSPFYDPVHQDSFGISPLAYG